ncbi:MAG: CHASE3 domain-containing protein [Proteobacteria bacterium]|nr:CHASE3 domain-containing protein [Pseudomonadota bacterium]
MLRKPLNFVRTATVERTVVALMALAFLLLAAVGAASYVANRKAHALAEEAARHQKVRRATRQILIDTLNAETGQRGYLITGQRDYLDVHREAKSRLTAEMIDLRRQVDGSREEARLVDALKIQIDAKLAELAKTVAFMDAHRREEALVQVRGGAGRAYMVQIRALIDRLDRLEGALVARNSAEAEQGARLALTVNLVSAILVAIVGLLSLLVIRSYVNDLRRSREALDSLNQGLERAVAERTEELVRANEEIQRFAYIVSHDLRAPLVNVMGYTAELEGAGQALRAQMERIEAEAPKLLEPAAKLAIDEDVPEAIGFIRSSTEKMDRLIKAILKLSRDGRRVLAPEALDMTAQVRAVAESLNHQAGEQGASIKVESLPGIVSDRLAIDQIFGNLLDNALKYLDAKRAGQIVVRGREEPPFVVYEIEDNGRGVADRDHERIFELFRRAGTQDRPGEGLGLAFVKNTVRRLGGSIDLKSELGKGSTFILKFPKRLIAEASESGDVE